MFTEIAARLYHMFKKASYEEDVKVTITFPTSYMMFEFQKNIMLELKSYQLNITSEKPNLELNSFEFNGIKWELKS